MTRTIRGYIARRRGKNLVFLPQIIGGLIQDLLEVLYNKP